jgi:hypothetical protein
MSKIGKILLSLVVGFLLSVPAVADSDQPADDHEAGESGRIELSDAETLLWMTDHLGNIEEPVWIRYDFARTGSYGDGFTDRVELEVVEFHDNGAKTASMEFFTGPRKQPVHAQQLSQITGNPVLAIFMQGDVMEMNRITDGSWRYFQRQIKHALAGAAQFESVTLDFNGEQVSGKKVTIAPFVDDERRAHFDRYADKTYEFIFSEEVPGMLYQIRTVIPDNINIGAEPLVKEVLQFSESGDLDSDTTPSSPE